MLTGASRNCDLLVPMRSVSLASTVVGAAIAVVI
jgi:hypothetical protein